MILIKRDIEPQILVLPAENIGNALEVIGMGNNFLKRLQ